MNLLTGGTDQLWSSCNFFWGARCAAKRPDSPRTPAAARPTCAPSGAPQEPNCSVLEKWLQSGVPRSGQYKELSEQARGRLARRAACPRA